MRTAPLLLLLLLCGHGLAQDDIRLFRPSPHPADSSVAGDSTRAATGRAYRTNDGRTGLSVHAAERDSLRRDSVRPGSITVVESGRIRALMANYAAHERPLQGYRIQIFIGGREKAESTRRAFLLAHPDIPAYLSYLAPNFRVRVGDLRDRVDAAILREELKDAFPGLYVVPDKIEPPRLATDGN